MKHPRRPSPSVQCVESRWLMILPVAALALGCESSATTSSSAEPVRDEGSRQEPAEAKSEEAQGVAKAEVPTSAEAEGEVDPEKAGQPATETPEAKHPAASAKKPTPTETSKSPMRRGGAVNGNGFSAWIEGEANHAVNAPSSVTVVLNAKEPYKCNDKYPYRFTAAPSPGLKYDEETIRNMNVGKQRSTMSIPFTPSAAGEQTVSGELSFSVCTDDKCLIEKQNLSITVDVRGS